MDNTRKETLYEFILNSNDVALCDRLDELVDETVPYYQSLYNLYKTLPDREGQLGFYFTQSYHDIIVTTNLTSDGVDMVESRVLEIPFFRRETGDDPFVTSMVNSDEFGDIITRMGNSFMNMGHVLGVNNFELNGMRNLYLTVNVEPNKETMMPYGIESVSTISKRPGLKQAVDSTLAIFKMLSKSEYQRIKDTIEGFTKESELIDFLINPINVYFLPLREPTGLELKKIVEKEGIILTEHCLLPFKGRIEVDGVLHPVRSSKQLTIYHTYVRKNQQIAQKENKSAEASSDSDVLGMANGAGRAGTFSDSEQVTMLQQNNWNVLKELNGPGSSDSIQKKEMRGQLANTGEVKLADLSEGLEQKKVLWYLDHVLKSMGIDSDVVSMPE